MFDGFEAEFVSARSKNLNLLVLSSYELGYPGLLSDSFEFLLFEWLASCS